MDKKKVLDTPFVFKRGYETFVMIKPGAVRRGYTMAIIKIILATGLRIKKIKKIFSVSREQLEKHYNKDLDWFVKVGKKISQRLQEKGETPTKSFEAYGRDALEEVIQHMLSGHFFIIIFEGENAVEIIQGLTDTIREKFGKDIVDNAFHRSDPGEEPREIDIWDSYFEKAA
ncbi:MAG: nucleoside-diphosphate kinase [Patescibacteria group bacterium]|jgi:nucleoside diphosphate kinase